MDINHKQEFYRNAMSFFLGVVMSQIFRVKKLQSLEKI